MRPTRGCRRAATWLALAGALGLGLVPPAASASPTTQEQLDGVTDDLQGADASRGSSAAAVDVAVRAVQEADAQLPGARAAVQGAREEQAAATAEREAARARLSELRAAQAAAEAALRRAQEAVAAAERTVARVARAVYTDRVNTPSVEVFFSGRPLTEVVDRAFVGRRVLQAQSDALDDLERARAERTRRTAEVTRLADDAQETAGAAEAALARSRAARQEAEAAQAEVEALSARRSEALAVAEAGRAADEARYAALQQESAALEARLAAEAEAARQAEEARRAEAARQAEAARAAEAARQAEAARAAEAARQAEAARSRRTTAPAPRPAPAPPPRAAAPAPAPPAARSAPTSSGGVLSRPAPGRLSSGFGYRTHPIYGDRRMHAGQDFAAPTGTPVRAAAAGRVVQAVSNPGATSGYGSIVVVDHGVVGGQALATTYAHLSSVSVRAGQRVERGQLVGAVGSTGGSTGPHLHFEVRVAGTPVDPRRYLG